MNNGKCEICKKDIPIEVYYFWSIDPLLHKAICPDCFGEPKPLKPKPNRPKGIIITENFKKSFNKEVSE